VIGLPANIFYGTGIPTTILVFKKKRATRDVLFIDASNEFEKAKSQNRLTQANIDKIMQTYQQREDVERYAHLATFDEIKGNDYNLNIPRYVETFEAEQEIDLAEVKKQLAQDNQEIAELEATIASLLEVLGA
ncbi:MAG: SAM-dependent methyltransferase, partial [Propionibacteriaceae bacterium]|jgi:type I restriction enzyme M protein|nr:SAM-dependent methyltransferase [Propionibacteriaceae bacterium]